MKKLIILCTVFLLCACTDRTKSLKPNVNVTTLTQNRMDWWIYHNNNIHLSRNFTAYDVNGNEMDRGAFIKELTTGKFIPIKLIGKDSLTYYQLFKLQATADQRIEGMIKNVASTAYKHYQWIGKKIPQFEFEDLKGNVFTNKNTQGKIRVIKLWFIACKPCVQEIPKLNKLVASCKNRDDILFLAPAFDAKKELLQFVSETPFSYHVIPNQTNFIYKSWKAFIFPTHIVVNKNGIVEQVVSDADELIYFLNRHYGISLDKSIKPEKFSQERMPPPPPPYSKKH